MNKLSIVNLIIMSFLFFAGLIAVSAHFEHTEYPDSVMNNPPINVIRNGEMVKVKLTDVYDFHGDACPGATMAYRAFQYGIQLLFGDEIPEVNDLIVISRAPGGPKDVFDLVIKGNDPSKRSMLPDGIIRKVENFEFQFLRNSTMEAVIISLKESMWPDDWFELREKNRAGTITETEKEKRLRDRKNVINTFPEKSFTELFGEPEVYKFIYHFFSID